MGLRKLGQTSILICPAYLNIPTMFNLADTLNFLKGLLTHKIPPLDITEIQAT
jgi:hypothetical protein